MLSGIFTAGQEPGDDERRNVSRQSPPDACHAALLDLVEAVESRGENSFVASILVLEGKELQHAAAPNLPARYKEAVNGIEIGAGAGSCGTAAFCGHAIYVSDIATDPLWAPWSEITNMALEAGLRACWSMPIMSSGKVLGTFAIYHREPRSPTVAERDLIGEAARSAAILIGANAKSNCQTPDALLHR
jgi:GAF domain-containing protein